MSLLKQLLNRRHRYQELAASIREHLEEKIDDLMEGGLSREEATRIARREFGNAVLIEERSREVWQWPMLESLWADAKLAFRQLGKSRVFTVAVLSALALGIGANTAIFSVIDAVLLKSLDYPDPDRIVQFLLVFPEGGRPGASIPDFRLWREQTGAFQNVSAYDFGQQRLNLTGDAPEQVRGLHVTADYFRLFGAPILLGRAFTTEEGRPNGRRAAVLSYGLWKRRFGGTPDIAGRTISLENAPYTVVGVTDESFYSDPPADLWIPFQFSLNSNDPTHYFQVAGRLQSGISLTQANAELKSAAVQARRSSFADSKLGFEVKPLRDAIVGDARSSLLLIGAAACLVLLIACANVANLLLVRATGRNRELAIRSALGAGRARIARQLLTESIVLSFAGGLLGLAIGLAGVRMLLLAGPGNIPRLGQGGPLQVFDWRMLVFTLGLSVFTGILFGLYPALNASRPDLNRTLKESGHQQGAGFRQTRMRSLLVIGEMSLAVVLLIGAALLIRTFIALREVNPGFESHNVLTMDMSLAGTRFTNTASVSRLVSKARLRISAIPGVENSTMTCCPPFESRLGLPFLVMGPGTGGSSVSGDAGWMDVSPGYFDVFKIPIIRGRAFTERDNEAAPRVAIVNEALAKRFWPDQNPLGHQILIGEGLGRRFKDEPRQIIGVVGNTRDIELSRAPEPTIIIPQAQESGEMTAFGLQFGPTFWLVRTRAEPHQVASIVARQLSEASGGLPVGAIRSMDEVMSRSVARQKFNMRLLTIFAISALVLTMVGIYGVMAYSIAHRRQEIAIRLALGAGRTRVRNMVLKGGMLLAISGVLLGVGAAFGLVRFIAGFLFGVPAWDPVVFLSVPFLLLSVALIATWLPARRAMRIDPMRTLRME